MTVITSAMNTVPRLYTMAVFRALEPYRIVDSSGNRQWKWHPDCMQLKPFQRRMAARATGMLPAPPPGRRAPRQARKRCTSGRPDLVETERQRISVAFGCWQEMRMPRDPPQTRISPSRKAIPWVGKHLSSVSPCRSRRQRSGSRGAPARPHPAVGSDARQSRRRQCPRPRGIDPSAPSSQCRHAFAFRLSASD